MSSEPLHEAIINAFCHRDWHNPDYVQIAIFKNRVEIRNPGRLYGGLTIDDLHRGNVSKRRNPLIADLFRRIELVESWGRGMMLIHENAPTVSFREVADLFIASFARPSFSESDATQETTQETTQEIAGTTCRILDLLRANPQATRLQLAAQTGLTADGVKYHLNKLKTAGRIRHQGPTKSGYWQILDGGAS